jgi:uncharacterized protein GlcG (DUF336 family)
MAKQVALEAAERIIEAGRKKAEEMGTPMRVAVADGGANLVAFARMDGALLVAAGGRLVVFGGGIPLTDEDGRVVGGIGVSGGSVEQDQDVAAAGAAAF